MSEPVDHGHVDLSMILNHPSGTLVIPKYIETLLFAILQMFLVDSLVRIYFSLLFYLYLVVFLYRISAGHLQALAGESGLSPTARSVPPAGKQAGKQARALPSEVLLVLEVGRQKIPAKQKD